MARPMKEGDVSSSEYSRKVLRQAFLAQSKVNAQMDARKRGVVRQHKDITQIDLDELFGDK